jgi:hypothetical protein
MSFDVGMGRCTEMTEQTVTVQLDSVLVRKWFPGEPWRKTGTSLLRFDRKLCSETRPPKLDEEIYISTGALTQKSIASLDLRGNGAQTMVDLRAILKGLDPLPPPAPRAKSSPRRGDTNRR